MPGLLEGVTVLDLGQYISAPYCARVLADFGASTIKVEPPAGDVARSMGPFPEDVPHPERSGLFLALNLNKRGVTLNLHTAEGREILLRMVGTADVVLENYPPDYLSSLGLEYDAFRKVNPGVILVSITPFGAEGARRDWKATDLTLFHMGGFAMNLPGSMGDPDRDPPVRTGGHQSEFLAGTTAVTAVVSALFQRRRTGRGCHVDLSTLEGVAGMMSFPEVTRSAFPDDVATRSRTEPRRGVTAILPCKDGYVAYSVREQAQWVQLMELMGNPSWAKEERFLTREQRTEHGNELWQFIADWTRTRSKQDLYVTFQSHHIPCFPVNTTADLFQEQQLVHRGFFQEMDHPVAGKLPYLTFPGHFSNATWRPERPAPILGQHNIEVLVNSLGYSAQDLPRLAAAGVI
ncbi:MAG: CoA transferase [Chloroflexi bacterium]|nr:CoA transferase [Chloroflexota bacterium]